MFPLLKPGHLPALGSTTLQRLCRQNAMGEGSHLEKPLSLSTWQWVWADSSPQRLPCLSPVTIFHDLRVHELRRSKRSNLCKTSWSGHCVTLHLRFQRQRATQGLVPLAQGCDRGKQNTTNPTTTHLQTAALLTQHSPISTQKIFCFSGCSGVPRYAHYSN